MSRLMGPTKRVPPMPPQPQDSRRRAVALPVSPLNEPALGAAARGRANRARLTSSLANHVTAHLRPQHLGHDDRTVCLLILFQDGDHGAPHRQA